jgi:gas vesicle protein
MSKTVSKVIVAGIAGLAAGVAIGILFAPTKGSKTRKRIKKKLLEFADSMEDRFSEKIQDLRTVITEKED